MNVCRAIFVCGFGCVGAIALGCSGTEGPANPSTEGTGGGTTLIGASGGLPNGTGGTAAIGVGGIVQGMGGVVQGMGGVVQGMGGIVQGAGGVDSAGGATQGSGGTTSSGGTAPDTGGTSATGGATQGTGGAPLPPVTPPGPPGPEDGDPNKPIVAIPNVACRNPSAPSFGLGQPNVQVDGRDVIVDYPCDKHEGAPMTFILNLHGTTPENLRFYQWGYFSAYKHVSSHNLIIATPKSVVDQWGNGDNGQDAPYLMDVIAWVYSNFAAYDIRAMWVGGHSWGSFYASQFGCRAEIADRVKGIILMSGARTPACAASISIINSAANLKPDPNDSTKTIVSPEALLDQASLATSHGCDAAQTQAVDANNDETFWPNCDPGFVHANYLMKTKQHADFMDASVVLSIVDWVKMSRQ